MIHLSTKLKMVRWQSIPLKQSLSLFKYSSELADLRKGIRELEYNLCKYTNFSWWTKTWKIKEFLLEMFCFKPYITEILLSSHVSLLVIEDGYIEMICSAKVETVRFNTFGSGWVHSIPFDGTVQKVCTVPFPLYFILQCSIFSKYIPRRKD